MNKDCHCQKVHPPKLIFLQYSRHKKTQKLKHSSTLHYIITIFLHYLQQSVKKKQGFENRHFT